MLDSRRREVAGVFGSRVRDRRLARRWTLEELAERAGLHYTYVGVVERGEANITLFNAVRIAAALDVNPAELTDGLTPG